MIKINKWKSFSLYFSFVFTKVLILINLYLFTFMFKALNQADIKWFIIWVCISIVSSLITYLLCYYRDLFLTKVCEKYKMDLREFIFHSHASEEGQKIILNKPGAFKSITIENVDMYVEQYIKGKYTILGNAFGFSTALGIMGYFSWMVAISASILIAICLIATILLRKKLSKNRREFMEIINEQDDMFSNMLDLRNIFYLNNSSMKLARMFNDKYNKTQNIQVKKFLKYTLYYSPNVLTNQSSTFAIASISGILAAYNKLPLELLASITFITSNLVADARDFSFTLFTLFSNKDLNKKFSPLNEIKKIKVSRIDEDIDSLDTISYMEYNITFKEESLFKKPFNFVFEKGNKYAIVGESGTGKSTLINSLMKKNDGFEGNIKINGNELEGYELETLVKNIGLLNSTPYVFEATLFENITMFEKNIKDNKVRDILEKIHFLDLDLHEKINLKSISEGQKQKINLARVMFKNPDWIISDEGFSNMDSHSRKKAIEYIVDEFKGGIINITHHLKNEEEKKYDKKISF